MISLRFEICYGLSRVAQSDTLGVGRRTVDDKAKMKRLAYCFDFVMTMAGRFGKQSFPASHLFYDDFELGGVDNWNSSPGGDLMPAPSSLDSKVLRRLPTRHISSLHYKGN
jgi:hypothetical protein